MIGCIIQARMNSTRLPGKVMKLLDNKNPSLFYTINQLKSASKLDKIIVATTQLAEDDKIEEFSIKNGIECFRGEADNVLDRFYTCAKKYELDVIVRITADCPLIDPNIVNSAIQIFNSDKYDYIHNQDPRTFPDGLDIEVFTFNVLEKAWKNAVLPSEKEHVTPYFRNHKEDFKIKSMINEKNLSFHRWTLDYKEDLELIRKIIQKINHRPILIEDIILLFNKEPNLFEINKNYLPNDGFQRSLEEDKKFLTRSNDEL
jgi:spore coat polysaccharide biosynthesis protein SpsF